VRKPAAIGTSAGIGKFSDTRKSQSDKRQSQSANGAVDSALDLKLDGKKVAGTISSQLGESKIEGELADGKLTFWFTMDMNGQALNLTFTGTQQKDGTLAGTLSLAGQGEMTWTGTRAK